MARLSKKDSLHSSQPKEETTSIKQLIDKHNELTLRVTFVQAVLDITRQNFGQHDGLEPANLVVTSDGRRVPEAMIQSIINEMDKLLLVPSQNELKKLESRKV
jgi:hypothetical protein